MTVTLPSETPRGLKWLANFAPRDRPTAQLLIDSIQVVAATRLRAELKRTLIESLKGEAQGTCNLLALGEDTNTASTEDLKFRRSGSDLVVAEIVERAAHGSGQRADQNIEQMRKARTERLLLVTDYVGSGDQVMSMVDRIYRSPSIRSWHSGRLMTVEVCCFTLTTDAMLRLQQDPRIDSVNFVEIAMDIDTAMWTSAERQAVRDLCFKYASVPTDALGWGSRGGLWTSGVTFPNNTPLIFRQLKGPRGGRWHPFLPGSRQAGWDYEGETMLADYAPPREFGDTMTSLNRVRYSTLLPRDVGILLRSGFALPTLDLLKVLAAVASGKKNLVAICTLTGLTRREVLLTVANAQRLGLLADNRSLTGAGHGFLKYPVRKRRLSTRFQSTKAAFVYYPQQLR